MIRMRPLHALLLVGAALLWSGHTRAQDGEAGYERARDAAGPAFKSAPQRRDASAAMCARPASPKPAPGRIGARALPEPLAATSPPPTCPWGPLIYLYNREGATS